MSDDWKDDFEERWQVHLKQVKLVQDKFNELWIIVKNIAYSDPWFSLISDDLSSTIKVCGYCRTTRKLDHRVHAESCVWRKAVAIMEIEE